MRSLLLDTAKKVFSRGLPVAIASTFLHVGIAAALVVGTGGHRAVTPTTLVLEVDVSPDLEPTPVVPEQKEEEEAKAPTTPKSAAPPALPTHTHPYDVAPSHDAHPHDPSMVHDNDHHSAEQPPSPAEPAPVLAAADLRSTPNDSSPMPRFTIAIGNGKPSSNMIAMGAIGSGSGAQSGTGMGTGTPSATPTIVPESAVSTPAKLVSSVIAAYPPDARQNDMEADVPVEIVVDAHGTVTEARVVRAAGSGFDESALVAIKRYRFTPAQRDGRVVSVRMRWSVQFRLR